MTTDTSEKGVESLIVGAMTAVPPADGPVPDFAYDPQAAFGGTGWILGDAKDYEREYAVDLGQLRAFIEATQRDLIAALLKKDNRESRG